MVEIHLPQISAESGKEDAMHRHFSNRGEALAEVTAARMLGARKYSAKSASITQDGRRVTTQQWFLAASGSDSSGEDKTSKKKRRRHKPSVTLF